MAAPKTPIQRPTAAVGVVCLRGEDVLMIQRGRPPLAGAWSLPGGKIEWGERAAGAALRELREETGVEAELLGLIDVVDGLFLKGEEPVHYVLIDYAASWISGAPTAADDAAQAVFVPRAELARLDLWDETVRIIEAAYAQFGGAAR